MLTEKAKVSAKKNVTGFLFAGHFSQHDLWPYFMGCLLQRNSDNLEFLDRLHCRASRIDFFLPKDMASNVVL